MGKRSHLALAVLLAVACGGGPGSGSATQATDTTETDGATTATGSETQGATDETAGATDSEAGGETETGGQPLEPPDLSCPGDPAGGCDDVAGAPLEAGAAVLSLLPECWERWIDKDDNGKYEANKDEFLDCGCDQLCADDPGYTGPDEGEGDGIFQAIWLAGFGNGRAAAGIRGTDLGLVGDGDGWWARTLVLRQGNTTVALVVIDTVGYFNDDVLAVRGMLGDAGLDLDYLVVQGIHNHQGPDTMGMWGAEFLVSGYDEAYGAQVRRTIVDSIAAGIADLRPVAELVVGEVDASTYADNGIANVLRDSRDPWVVDPILGAARLVDGDGATIASLVSYGCHPETLSSKNILITSDFSHALRRTLEVGSEWAEAPGRPGFGGPAIYINGAVGGMMTTLGVSVTNPDGDTYQSASFDKADSIGQLLGEMAIDAIELGEVINNPRLSVASAAFRLSVFNTSFQFLFDAGVLQRTTYPPANGRGPMEIQTEMAVINLGPIQMLTIPGEILPELVVGGYDGSQIHAPGVPLVKPDNPNPPALAQAPAGPYIKDRMGGTYRWIVGLGNDELGYIIPEYDFVLADDLPYVNQAPGDHYEEVNSLGSHVAGVIDARTDALTAWSAAHLGQ